MEMPRPNEHHQRLAAFHGIWKGEEKLYPSQWDPTGGTATGVFSYRMDLDGFFLICDYTQARGTEITFRGHGVYGWDDKQQCYTMYWFDSMGGGGPAAPAKGEWDGKRLVFQHAMPQGFSRYIHWVEGGQTHFAMETSRDGQEWKTMMEGAYSPA